MKKKCLLMCATPLQLLIVERIIELYPEKEFDLIVLMGETDNREKYTYYYNRVKKLCNNSILYEYRYGFKSFVIFRKKISKSVFNIEYNELYLANFQKGAFQYLVSKNRSSEIYTFDDGLGNILPSGAFHQSSKPHILRRCVWHLLGVTTFSQDIKKLSTLHYTIYRGLPNIIPNTKLVKLFGENESLKLSGLTKNIKIYLGQPLLSVNKKFTDSFITNILLDLNIGYYLPHPRESSNITVNFKQINTNLIAEDYIIRYIKENPRTKVEVYSFFSGALFNLTDIPNLECKYIYDDYIKSKYSALYETIKNHPKLHIIHPNHIEDNN